MVNESLQWAAIVVVALLLIGALRQIGLMLPPALRSGKSGPQLGRRVPRAVFDRVEPFLASADNSGLVLAFVSEGCSGCQRLLADLEGGRSSASQPLVLVVHRPSLAFKQALDQLPTPRIDDDTGAVWKAADIHATPLLLGLDPDGTVRAKEVTHRVDAFAAA